jgi:hypothetical protein
MTYGRAHFARHGLTIDGAAVNHPAELARGDLFARIEGPLIRPSGTFSPRGEGPLPLACNKTRPIVSALIEFHESHRLATG